MKKFEELTFTDDFMFYAVMTQNEKICKKVVELCIGRKVRQLRYKSGQETIKLSPESRGIRLDVYLEDDESTMYDIEMQTAPQADIGKRIRYYDGIMSMNSLEAGKHFSDLPNSYIVFICLFDPFKENRVIYEFCRKEKNNPDLTLDDGTVSILVNAAGDDSLCTTEMRDFLSVLRGRNSDSALNREISNAVNRIKYRPEWRSDYMLYEIKLKESRDKGYFEGKADGRSEVLQELTRKFILDGKSTGEIAGILSVSPEQIENIRQQMNITEQAD